MADSPKDSVVGEREDQPVREVDQVADHARAAATVGEDGPEQQRDVHAREAQLLGDPEAVRLLERTLQEEEETDEKLTEIAEYRDEAKAADLGVTEQAIGDTLQDWQAWMNYRLRAWTGRGLPLGNCPASASSAASYC